jgi:hypothetical protein
MAAIRHPCSPNGPSYEPFLARRHAGLGTRAALKYGKIPYLPRYLYPALCQEARPFWGPAPSRVLHVKTVTFRAIFPLNETSIFSAAKLQAGAPGGAFDHAGEDGRGEWRAALADEDER